MIKSKELTQYQPILRYADGSGMNLATIQNALMGQAANYQIPVQFYSDQIKEGGLLSSASTDCIVMFHPQHQNDYIKYVISVKRQGTMAFVAVDNYGISKNNAKLSAGSSALSDLKTSIFSKDPNESAAALGRAFANGLKGLGGKKSRKEEEQMWYSAMSEIIGNVIA